MDAHDMTPTPLSVNGRTDRSLLRRLRGGEEDAATALYLRYARRVQALAQAKTSAALARRVDPEDVVQSVFRTFFRRAAEGHYDVPEGDELWKLLLVISLNKIRTLAGFHRAAKRDVAKTVALENSHSAEAAAASEEEALRVLEMIIAESLAGLPEAQQEMIRLRIEGHGVAEIADATRRSKRSVERVLQQFRSRLGRQVLEEPPEDEPAL
jgi:RNA polymerase sigma-70 factor (ECF subfamily)